MSSAVETPEVALLAAELDAFMERLLAVQLTGAGEADQLVLWRSVESARRRMDPVEYRLIEETTFSGVPGTHGCATPQAFVAQLLTIPMAQARARVKNAGSFGPRRDIHGIALSPIFGHVAAAVGEGAVTAQAGQAIAKVIDELPDEVAAEKGDLLEQQMVNYARTVDSSEARKFAQLLAYAMDQDGRWKDAKKAWKRRGVKIVRHDDGTATITGDLTCELAELVQTVLDAYAAPKPATDGTPDPRSAVQRNHDGLIDAVRDLLQSEQTPATAGCRTTVVLHGQADQFARNDGTMTTGHGYQVPTELAKSWLEPEARAIMVLFSKTRGIEAYSSIQRLFTEPQRLVMSARDLGCCFPHCDRPAAWTQAHHVIEYHLSGHTRVDEGALVCDEHHRTFESLGWTNQMIDGQPMWIPPAWIDPTQTPRTNTRHHPPDL